MAEFLCLTQFLYSYSLYDLLLVRGRFPPSDGLNAAGRMGVSGATRESE
jgi:hypothetical protein